MMTMMVIHLAVFVLAACTFSPVQSTEGKKSIYMSDYKEANYNETSDTNSN